MLESLDSLLVAYAYGIDFTQILQRFGFLKSVSFGN